MMKSRNPFAPRFLLLACLLLPWPTAAAKAITVAHDGSGDYKTIQSAIDAVPEHNTEPVVIRIKPGTYQEKITIGRGKRFVTLKGEDAKTTVLTNGWNASHLGPEGRPVGTRGSSSVTIEASDFVAENLTFENSAGDTGQAVALAATGDRQAYRNCRVLGWQDTLYANGGRQYYDHCDIEGRVDFIFGNAVAVFDHCILHSRNGGHVTAASTEADKPWGYVFLDCKLSGDAIAWKDPAGMRPGRVTPQADLGRPWRTYASVTYVRCEMGPHIAPQGWSRWRNGDDSLNTARFAEYACTGLGADRAGRVAWGKELTKEQAGQLTVEKILGGSDGWSPTNPAVAASRSEDPTCERDTGLRRAQSSRVPPVPGSSQSQISSFEDAPKSENRQHGRDGRVTESSPGAAQPAIPRPSIPDHTFTITDYGALADGKTLATDALLRAIDAAKQAGGGIVRVPAGRFLTSPFALASHINLHLDQGATLSLVNDLESYPKSGRGYADWITADGCQDLAITGQGTIDGQGQPWWDKYRKRNGVAPTGLPHRPQMIRLRNCTRVLVEGVTLANSPNVHLITDDCEDVTIEGIIIQSPADSPNTDGLNPSGWNYHIAHCTIDTGDDNIAIKAHASRRPGKPSCENIVVEHCTFRRGHGMSIGGQTPGGLRHLVVRDCSFESTDAGIRLKAPRGQGGLVEDCAYERLAMKKVKVPIYITSYYPSLPKDVAKDPAQPVTRLTPIWRNIRISDVNATDCPEAGRIFGLPEMPVSDVVLTNVSIRANRGLQVVHAKNVRLVNCDIVARQGPSLITHDAEVAKSADGR